MNEDVSKVDKEGSQPVENIDVVMSGKLQS